jgi:transcription factor S
LFCPNCKSLMFPQGGRMVCRKCGHVMANTKADAESSKTRSLKNEKERLVVDKNAPGILPKTKIMCPKCGNNEAYWMMQQTRGADEPETRFYICTKCEKRWRENQ